MSLRDLRAVGMGLRMLVRKGDPRKWPGSAVHLTHSFTAQLSSNHDIVGEEEYTVHRVMHGVPEGVVDLPPMQAIAMNSNLDMMGGSELSLPSKRSSTDNLTSPSRLPQRLLRWPRIDGTDVPHRRDSTTNLPCSDLPIRVWVCSSNRVSSCISP